MTPTAIHLLTEQDRTAAKAELGAVPIIVGRRKWRVVFEPIPMKRTLEQNTRLHKVFQLVAAATGNTVPAVKQAYKEKYLAPKYETRDGEKVKTWPRTRDLEIEEMDIFFRQVSGDAAAEYGVMLMPQDR